MTNIMFFGGKAVEVKIVNNQAYHKDAETKRWFRWGQQDLCWKKLAYRQVPVEIRCPVAPV